MMGSILCVVLSLAFKGKPVVIIFIFIVLGGS